MGTKLIILSGGGIVMLHELMGGYVYLCREHDPNERRLGPNLPLEDLRQWRDALTEFIDDNPEEITSGV